MHGDFLGECPEDKDAMFNNEALTVLAYPNPFAGSCNIDLSITESSKVEIQVTDLLGRTVTHIYSGNLDAGDYSFNWKTEQSNTIYLLNVSTESETKTVKLMTK